MTPKILASSLSKNRELRRQQLIDAAISIAVEGDLVSVSAVAKKAGMSRATVYEYFASSADIITELVIEEMEIHAHALVHAIGLSADPLDQIENWIRAALEYAADGRHMLIKSFSVVTPPEFRREEVVQGHRKLMATLFQPLVALGIDEPRRAASFVQSVVDTVSQRIDSGKEKDEEIEQAVIFVVAGLRAMMESLESVCKN